MQSLRGKWIIGVTGASGMKYALRLIELASQTLQEAHVVFSEAALVVLREEEGLKLSSSRLSTDNLFGKECKNVFFYNPKDIGAAIASGSMLFDGMVVAPCTMGTLGAIASGQCLNLIHRAADVTLKEGRKLILVPRETPLSAIHLENMLRLSKLGVSIVPAMPGFYHNPASISDLVDMMVMKIMDQMGIHRDIVPRWGSDASHVQRSDNPIRAVVVSLKKDV